MEDVRNTRIRFISAKDPRIIERAINSLQFKVEIKHGPEWNGQKFYCWFVIPDTVEDLVSIDFK